MAVKPHISDPVLAADADFKRNLAAAMAKESFEQFQRDLNAMNKGQDRGPGSVQKRMHSKNFGLVEHMTRHWRGILTEGQTLEDALDPKFWVDQVTLLMGPAKNLGRGDIIEVYKPDTGLYAELVVREIGVGYVRVKLVQKADGDVVHLSADGPLSTRWNVGNKTHEVIRKSDMEVLARGFQTKGSAVEWINKHLQEMAAA